MNKLELLRKVPAFSRLSDAQLELLAASVGSQTFERGDMIFHQDSVGSTLYIIVSGQVRIFTTSEAGQEFTVTIFRAGDFFGELAMLDEQPRSASARAIRPTRTLTLHRAAFLRTINDCPPLAAAVLEAMALRLRRSTVNAEHLASLPAPRRVVRQLIALGSRYGVPCGATRGFNLEVTQDDLASLSGTTRETVNRVLSGLRDQGLIRVERARVSVLDLPALEQALAQWQW